MFDSLYILDLSTVLAGPSVATFFAELGAEVVKIENTNQPDVTRSWRIPGEQQEISSYFSSINYCKTYVQKDLMNSNDKLWIESQIKKADILIMNFKPKDYVKFNLTKKILHELNPRLIVGSISGFGDESDRVAYDLILQAETGFMAMNGEEDSNPLKMPIALIDVLAAHHLKEAILIALLNRFKTGKGSWVSVSLYDAAVSSLVNQSAAFLMNGILPKQQGSLHPNIAPYGEIFQTNDDKHVTFAIGSDNQFIKLCEILQCSSVSSDIRFDSNVNRVKNRRVLQGILKPFIEKFNSDDLVKAMNLNYIPMGVIKNLDAVFRNPETEKMIKTEKISNTITKRISQIAFKWK